MACQSRDAKLERAFRLAGENRGELEKVLQHYSRQKADSLKLRAARFLIGNMPGHCTLVCPELEAIRQDSARSYFERKVWDICAGNYADIRSISERREDVQYLTSDFLIRHIDASFALLEKYPWNRNLPFELFLEYLLPYRLEYEEVDFWRDSFRIHPGALADLNSNDDLKYDAWRADRIFKFEQQPEFSGRPLELFGEKRFSDCRDLYLRKEFEYRALGVTGVLDFLPCYPNRNGYHYWSYILSPFRKQTAIDGARNSKAAKVYRRTFSRQLELKPAKGERIPDLFTNPFNKDVTATYFHTADVTINMREKLQGNQRYAYLCVFNNLAWQPIAIGEVKGKKVRFEDMGKDLAYLPVYYHGTQRRDLDYPFILRMNGRQDKLIPDTTQLIHLHLIRKYPYGERVFFDHFFDEVYMEASETAGFQRADTVFNIRMGDHHYMDLSLSSEKKYRYWRVAHPRAVANIAEFMFWDRNGQSIQGMSDEAGMKCLDGDPLTAIAYKTKQVVLDFGEPVAFSRVVCLPRSDGNGIYAGDEYELMYYGRNGWVSLGSKIATDFFIDFSDVPSGALYWLRNLSGGVEERIFTYENGEIRFW